MNASSSGLDKAEVFIRRIFRTSSGAGLTDSWQRCSFGLEKGSSRKLWCFLPLPSTVKSC